METFAINKMRSEFRENLPVLYFLESPDGMIELNRSLGKTLRLVYSDQIECQGCSRKIKKSFAQGYCYPCFKKLAVCDLCLMKPETCHYHLGSCREPSWGEAHCMIPHTIYLANSSGLKVGITRGLLPMGRWIDQGAVQGIRLATVNKRLDAGLVEVKLKEFFKDKTNWRAMLQNKVETLDLATERRNIASELPDITGIKLAEDEPVSIQYPVLEYPEKIKSLNFDKTATIEGTLLGIKGQYLIFDYGVINLRKFSGYHIRLEAN